MFDVCDFCKSSNLVLEPERPIQVRTVFTLDLSRTEQPPLYISLIHLFTVFKEFNVVH